MEKEKFSELWMQIGNVADDIINSCGDQNYMAFNREKKSYIEYEYEKFRKLCKEKHMLAHGTSSKTELPRIDRHKVAACIAGAIMSTKPMEYRGAEDVPRLKISFLANETLALFSALGIVKSFIRADKENQSQLDESLKAAFLKEGFIFPTPVHDDYLPWLLYLLQECSIIGFNVISFSNILYLLETYTFSQLELKGYGKKAPPEG